MTLREKTKTNDEKKIRYSTFTFNDDDFKRLKNDSPMAAAEIFMESVVEGDIEKNQSVNRFGCMELST